ncbi:hypothetical protein ACQKWADRAFT_216277 [Trichoderma austrokoningii]
MIKSNLLAASSEVSAAVKGNYQDISGSSRSVLVLVLLIGEMQCFPTGVEQVTGEHMASCTYTYSLQYPTTDGPLGIYVAGGSRGPDQEDPRLHARYPLYDCVHFIWAMPWQVPRGLDVERILRAADASFRRRIYGVAVWGFSLLFVSWGSGPLGVGLELIMGAFSGAAGRSRIPWPANWLAPYYESKVLVLSNAPSCWLIDVRQSPRDLADRYWREGGGREPFASNDDDGFAARQPLALQNAP